MSNNITTIIIQLYDAIITITTLCSTCEEGMFTCTEKDCSVDCVISEYAPGPCSEECGSGVIIGVATILIQPENGGTPCPELEVKLDECYGGDCCKYKEDGCTCLVCCEAVVC